jgi:hypothetical protein
MVANAVNVATVMQYSGLDQTKMAVLLALGLS